MFSRPAPPFVLLCSSATPSRTHELFTILCPRRQLLAASSTLTRSAIRTSSSSRGMQRDPCTSPAFSLPRRLMEPYPLVAVSKETITTLMLRSFSAQRFSVSSPSQILPSVRISESTSMCVGLPQRSRARLSPALSCCTSAFASHRSAAPLQKVAS
jgi:hypothetical protein